jgi:transcriptional regulator with GAF, ATPase, and Fis domain
MSETLGHTLGATDAASCDGDDPPGHARLYLVFESTQPRATSTWHSLADLDRVVLGRGGVRGWERATVADERQLLVRVADRWMSTAHARLTPSFDRWLLEDAGSKNGSRVNGRAVGRHVLRDGDVIELGRTLFLFRDRVPAQDGEPLDWNLDATVTPAHGFITLSTTLAQSFAKLAQLATADVAVLILGASGTGKEVLARAVHLLSGRTGACVAVNCGAIPETLIESELFGHRKGAFSGAVADRIGLVRSADGGTLFLDEIGDLAPPSQAALLRVLQEREVRAVGDTRTIPVDIRLISATHQDLTGMVERGGFRQDLYARISGHRITLPQLRDRREDLGMLIRALLPRVAGDRADEVTFEIEAARALFGYDWPLNIRELENALATAAVLAGDSPIARSHLPEALQGGSPRARSEAGAAVELAPIPGLSSEQVRHREEVRALLQAHGGNVSAAARAAGKDRKQLQRWIKRYGLSPADYRE